MATDAPAAHNRYVGTAAAKLFDLEQPVSITAHRGDMELSVALIRFQQVSYR